MRAVPPLLARAVSLWQSHWATHSALFLLRTLPSSLLCALYVCMLNSIRDCVLGFVCVQDVDTMQCVCMLTSRNIQQAMSSVSNGLPAFLMLATLSLLTACLSWHISTLLLLCRCGLHLTHASFSQQLYHLVLLLSHGLLVYVGIQSHHSSLHSPVSQHHVRTYRLSQYSNCSLAEAS